MENFSEKIQSLRNEYSDLDLKVDDLNSNPITQFTRWLDAVSYTHLTLPTIYSV